MSGPAWPVIAVIGAVLIAIGAVLALLGAIADIAGNKPLSDRLFWHIGLPVVVFGTPIFFLGAFGWWTVTATAVVTVFGFLVRPKKEAL